MKRYFVLLVLLFCCTLASAGTFDYTGMSGSAQLCINGSCQPSDIFNIYPGNELTNFGNLFDLDIDTHFDSILLTFTQDVTFDGLAYLTVESRATINPLIFTVSGVPIPDISSSTLSGIRYTFSGANDTNSFLAGDYILLSDITQTPEPASLLLLAAGVPFLKRRHQI